MALDIAFAAIAGGLGGAVVAGVIVAFLRRHGADQDDINELAISVERIAKAQRRDYMQRVRASAPDFEGGSPAPNRAPSARLLETKDQLRARVFGHRAMPQGGPPDEVIELPKRGTP